MSNTTKTIIGVVIVLVLVIGVKSFSGRTNMLGAVNCNTNTCLTGGFQADTITSAGALTSDGAFTSGGTVTVTTTNAATSTTKLGCIQTVATSTASPIILVFGTSFTGTTTLPTGAANSAGLVAWKFGTCPQ